ncbi:hypothetical protein WJX72_005266 [[Myrmecia] bisecta]|uniref:Protein yippee-like n=1 Tax=[Myrmecia] bisecta TaxID=41462 RepID=A0AAW1PFG0_9CHLO
MGRPFLEWLSYSTSPKYVCACCGCDLACSSALIWEGVMGPLQPAFLFRATLNINTCSEQRQQRLSTGTYTLVDVACRCCDTALGWKYLNASCEAQKYKEGGTLLQKARLQQVTATELEQQEAALVDALNRSGVSALSVC